MLEYFLFIEKSIYFLSDVSCQASLHVRDGNGSGGIVSQMKASIESKAKAAGPGSGSGSAQTSTKQKISVSHRARKCLVQCMDGTPEDVKSSRP